MARTVTLLYFAAVKELVGAGEARLTLPGDVRTIGDLSSHLEQTEPKLAGRLGTVRFAVNESFVSPDALVSDGDVVAVIPPVSGG